MLQVSCYTIDKSENRQMLASVLDPINHCFCRNHFEKKTLGIALSNLIESLICSECIPYFCSECIPDYLSVSALCHQDGDPMSYIGNMSVSWSGSQCEIWQGSGYTSAHFLDEAVVAASNFCRKPGNEDPFGPGLLFTTRTDVLP